MLINLSRHALLLHASCQRLLHAHLYAQYVAQATAEPNATAQPAGKHSSLEADGSTVSSKNKREKLSTPALAAASAPTETSTDQAAGTAEPEAKRVRRATHVGRFKRREAGKRVQHYSSNDLTAILGGQPQAGAADAAPGFRAVAERAASPETPSASEPPKPTSSDLPRPEGACCVGCC